MLSNLYFLFIFGDDVEDNIGKYPFILLLFLATLFGNILHVLFDSNDTIPAIGASGGISGVLVFYALKWPKTPLSFIIRIYYRFKWIKVPAIFMFGLWLIIQIIGMSKQLTGYSSTSYLAHIGGVIVGFIFWLFYNVKEDENLKQVML